MKLFPIASENSINPLHHIAKSDTFVSLCLKHHFKVAEDRIPLLIQLGSVYVDKHRVFEDHELRKDQHLRVYLHPKRYPVEGVEWEKRIVKETGDFLVLDKPAGVPTIATVDNGLENVLEQLRRNLRKQLLVTSRLDTPTSGLLVLAKTEKFQTHYNQVLAEGKVEKIYEAVTEEEVPVGLMIHYMEPGDNLPKRVFTEPRKGWLKCALEVKTCEAFNEHNVDYFKVTLRLLSGRTHQIRAQFSQSGFPIVNDREYGFKGKAPIVDKKEIALRAIELKFDDQAFSVSRLTSGGKP